jgi:hypothetical protein
MMAHFRGEVYGARGPVSRLGHHELITKCNGWHDGIHVYAHRDDVEGDRFDVSLTGGSSGGKSAILIARYNIETKKLIFPALKGGAEYGMILE